MRSSPYTNSLVSARAKVQTHFSETIRDTKSHSFSRYIFIPSFNMLSL